MAENTTEWFENKLVELENELKKKEVLLDLKSVVLNSEKQVLNDIANNVYLHRLFECLDTSEDQSIESVCAILSELLRAMTTERLFEVYDDCLYKALTNQSGEVKKTILTVLEKFVNERSLVNFERSHSDLLMEVAECLASEDRSIAQGAISFFLKMGNYPLGVSMLYSNPVINKLKEVVNISDVAKLRVYEIMVNVSKLSSENLSSAVASNLMGGLLSELSSPDILIQLNALELLSVLATSNHGLNYLQEHDVIENLVNRVLKLDEDLISFQLLLPGLVEFFGNLCALQPSHFTTKYPQIMELLFNSLETNDEILMGVIITAIGKIGSTASGRLALNKYDDKMKNIFIRMGQILTKKTDLTITTMNSLCELLKEVTGETFCNQIASTWFDYIKPNPLDSIFILLKLPFVEFRLAGFTFLRAIATQEWGTHKLSVYPGMIEFLTDRSTEFNKDCKQTKFEVVFNMMNCHNIEGILNKQQLIILRDFVREGPFYVPVQVEMATEGAI